MSSELKLVLGDPRKTKTGSGYPAFDEIGNVTLPDTGETIPPSEYRWVTVTSEASPDMSRAAKGSVLTSGPVGGLLSWDARTALNTSQIERTLPNRLWCRQKHLKSARARLNGF
jgi:hypothetical protein